MKDRAVTADSWESAGAFVLHRTVLDRRTRWSAVSRIGSLDATQQDLTELWSWLPNNDQAVANQLVADVVRNKVVEIASRNLDEASPSTKTGRWVADGIRRHAIDRNRFREHAAGVMAHVLKIATSHRGHIIKGLALLGAYPEPGLRHINDIDLHFDSIEDALEMIGPLIDERWAWDTVEVPWVKWDIGGKPYGQLALFSPDAANCGARVRLDVHVGPYSFGYCGVLPLVTFERSEIFGVPVLTPSAETSLTLLVAHSVSDYFLSMKDVNDTSTIMQRCSVDWPVVFARCREVGLERFLDQILFTTGASYNFARVPTVGRDHRLLPLGAPRGWVRAMGTAALAFRTEGRWSRPAAGAIAASAALRYYTRNLSLRLGTDWPTALAIRCRNRYYCWRLVPQNVWGKFGTQATKRPHLTQEVTEELTPEMRMVRTKDGCVVVWKKEVFIPTVTGRINPSSLELARRLAQSKIIDSD